MEGLKGLEGISAAYRSTGPTNNASSPRTSEQVGHDAEKLSESDIAIED